MVTVSHLVKKFVKDKSFLQEALGRGIISFGNLAEEMKPGIEEELGKEVKEAAIVMALRRHAEELREMHHQIKSFSYESEILLKSSLMDITVRKTPSLLGKLKSLYSMVDYGKGDVLNIIVGNYELSIVLSEKYKERVLKFLKGEKVLNKEEDLVALTFTFSDDFLHTPGVIFRVLQRLAWENINIYEVVSTTTELTLILSKKDSMNAYRSLQDLIGKKED